MPTLLVPHEIIQWILDGAVFSTDRKLFSLFGDFIKKEEIANALEALARQRKISMDREKKLVVIMMTRS